MAKDLVNKIKFHFQGNRFFFPERSKCKRFLLTQLRGEGKLVDAINYIFCSDKELLQINRQFLKHDTLTDIVTFELSGKDEPLLSDIYISVDRIRENAAVFNATFRSELHRVIFHGALHLAGYKDKNKQQAHQMRNMEEAWLKKYSVSRETL